MTTGVETSRVHRRARKAPRAPRRIGPGLTRAAALAVALGIGQGAGPHAQALQEPPRFRSGIEVTSIDVTVVDGRGTPVPNLTPDDFEVQVDGDPRRVLSADWVPLVTEVGPPPPPPPDGYSTNESTSGGRLILIVIDQPNIRFGATHSIKRAVDWFLDRLLPSDRVAAVGLGVGTASTPFTPDRERIKRAIGLMSGQSRQVGFNEFDIAQTEAMEVRRGAPFVRERLINRECPNLVGPELSACSSRLMGQAMLMAQDSAYNGDATVRSLASLLRGLSTLDLPKTLIFVSEGFPLEEQRQAVRELGALAAAARTSVYTLRLDDNLFDVAEPRLPIAPFDDRRLRTESLEALAQASRGALFTITGSGAGVFEQIEAELSGYYLLAVESGPDDRDGKGHPIRVSLRRKGAVVRARALVQANPAADRERTPRRLVAEALGSPLPLAGLPLRVGAFSLLGPERDRIQLLFHADVGTGYAAPQRVALGYQITDLDGRLVDSQAADLRLRPVMSGVPSPLQYVAGASIPPGEYIFKLAVVEGDRVGTIEHRFKAALASAGEVTFSDLMVGGPVDAKVTQQPSVGHLVSFGSVQGYVEAYGEVEGLKAKFELADGPTGPPLVDREVAPQRVGGGTRAIFSDILLSRQLPPGRYVMRATVMGPSGEPLKTLTRGLEVAAPPVLMTSTAALGLSAVPTADVFLPVNDELFARPFTAKDTLRDETLQALRSRVAPAAISSFDQGIAALTAGQYAAAEQAFKDAIRIEADSAPILTYLAACYAASGHDQQAAAAWQTALIDGSEFADIYAWLGDVLVRARELSQARTILEEAVSKWPSDVRFALPLAITYAAFGQGREAVRMIQRHLEDKNHRNDLEALRAAVEWIYHLRLAGVTAHSPTEDVKLARGFADAFLKKERGQRASLVRQWMTFLERRPR